MLPKNENEALFYQLALTMVDGIGAKTANNLLQHFGSAKEILNAPVRKLQTIEGMGAFRAKACKGKEIFQQAEQELAFISKHGVQAIFLDDPKYPQRFRQCADPPVLLYYKGDANLNAEKMVAVIGTRKNTDYGQKLTEELIESFRGTEDLVVVSGLAYGIDGIAHKAALKNDLPTVGVVGHGLDKMYPTAHRSLAKEMLNNGGLLTEFPSGTDLNPSNFPVRNRIVAGISDVTIVVESDEKGGAMITAYMASSYNREVAAFPGRVTDKKSDGPNKLIRMNIASMIRSGDDLLELMNWKDGKKVKVTQPKLFLNLSEEEQRIVDALQDQEAIHSDELMLATKLSSSSLAATLLQLEMQGVVRSMPGKRYRLY